MVFSAVVHERREGYDIRRHVGSRHQVVNPVLQCVAVCCSVLQCVAVVHERRERYDIWRHVGSRH